MKITIHRGINQIGGCITEIATNKARILIDLGQNLPDNEGRVDDCYSDKKKIEELTQNIDAIFYTHYHGDHLGHFPFVPENVQQHIGQTAKKVALCKAQRLSKIEGRAELSNFEIRQLENMIPFIPEQIIVVGNIKITPYFVSHSAYDAYMFLIEADGKRVLHTGDFRDHGYLGKGLLAVIEKLILKRGNIDFLITEGTMLSRLDERVKHENDLKKDVIDIMKQYKNVFVMCSSTDMERLATYYAANKILKNKPFVCDDYQKQVLEIFSESAGKRSSLFSFKKVYSFWVGNKKLIDWMKKDGFCMLVRPTNKYTDYWNFIKEDLDISETVLIYSMWKEYVNPDSKHAKIEYLSFLNMFPNVKYIHTSGHASADCLTVVCNLVNPTLGIIPIHSEHSSNYAQLDIKEGLKNRIITTSQNINDVEIEIRN